MRKPASRQSRIARSSCSRGALVRGPVAGAVDDAEHLAGVGQRNDQRVITPGAVVGDVDALLAAGAGGDEGAVGVDDGLVEEVGRLLFPDLDAGSDRRRPGGSRCRRW